MDGYRLLRKGRLGRRGGGVALAPRVQLECTELHLGMNSDSAESLWVRISRQTNTGSIVEGVCYGPPAEEEVDETSDSRKNPHVHRLWSSWETLTTPISAEGITEQSTSNPGGFWGTLKMNS